MSAACYCDYEQPTVYRSSERVARKEHKCYECHRTIRPGERYERVFAIWDGAANNVCTCHHCLELRRWVVAHVPCSCWAHGNMLEDLRDDVDDYWAQAPGLLMGWLRRRAAAKRAQGYQRRGHGYVRA
jgi:hypothetical protein